MTIVNIDLEKLNSDILCRMAKTSSDINLLEDIYEIAIKNNDTDILLNLLQNGDAKTKKIVNAIAKYAKHEITNIELDDEMSSKKEEKVGYTFDTKLKDAIGINPLVETEMLIDMISSGEFSPLFNRALPGEVLESILTSEDNKQWISINSNLVISILKRSGYKLSKAALNYIKSIEFESKQDEIKMIIDEIIDRKKLVIVKRD